MCQKTNRNNVELPTVKNIISGGIEGIGNTFAKIVEKFKADPTKVAELDTEMEKAKLEAALKAEEISNQLEEIRAKELESVNQTIREEAKSEHWLVWSWRPVIGFTFCAILVNNYILLPYFKHHGIEIIVIPGEVWNAILVILGVASAGRSFTNWQKAKNS